MQGAHPAQPSPVHQSWNEIFREALLHAQQQIRPLRWRGAPGGVLPHGYDPNSIAAQAVLDTLKTLPRQTQPDNLDKLAQAIQRRVRQHVNRLHHLKENFLTRNEPDLALVLSNDGEPVRLVDTVVAPDPTPLEHLIAHERDLERLLFEVRFESFLGPERRLKKLFACYCAGLQKPLDLARKLKIRVQTVYNLRKLLRRRLAEFYASQSSAQI